MLKKIVLAGTVLFGCNIALSLLSSCEPDIVEPNWGGNNCSVLRCFHADSAWVTAYHTTNNAELEPAFYTATNIRLDVHLGGEINVCRNSPRVRQRSASLFSAAYALTPFPCPSRHGGDSIVAYNIYSDKNYDIDHPAGSSLNDIMDAMDFPQTMLEESNIDAAIYRFKFNTLPADSGRHVFFIDIVQLDGDTLSTNTETIYLKKP